MKKGLRRLRAASVVGLTWAAAWFGAGMILLFIVGFGAADVPFPLFFGLLGFIANFTFSRLIGVAERRRSFDQMSVPRFAAWGAAGGVLLATVFGLLSGLRGEILVLAPVLAAAGAICAAGSLGLARRASGQEALDAGPDLDDAGLSEEEMRDLLGDGD